MGSFRDGLASLALLLLCFVSWGSASVVRFKVTLTWEDWAPAGIARKMILTNGQFPAPPLYLRQGDDVEFLVDNQLPFATAVHFHGIDQTGTPWSDGVPGLSQGPIPSGSSFLYKWNAGQYGSYMYHAHSRGQIDDGLYGAIYIRPDDEVEKPFRLISNRTREVKAMSRAEARTTPIVLSDWRQLTSEELWHAEEATGLDAYCVNALLVNGRGSVQCLDRNTLDRYSAAKWAFLGNSSLTDIGCAPPTIPLLEGNSPHNFSATPPTVFSGCTPSQGSTELLLVDPHALYASFDLISATSVSMLTFSIDEHPMYIYAIDGRYIVPARVDAITIANGNRYSVMVKLDKPAGDYTVRLANAGINQLITTNASMSYDTLFKAQSRPSQPSIDITGANTTADVVIFDESMVTPFPVEVPAQEVAQTFFLDVARFNVSYRWILGNSGFPLSVEESPPLLFNRSAAKPALSISTRNGTWVDLIFRVTGPLQPPHPIHKHSNKFFVIGQGNGAFNYASVAEAMKYIPESFNLKAPQIRDTFATPPSVSGPTWLAIRYQVVNPGAFLIHCHIQVHLSGGMALAMLDGVDKWPVHIPEEYRLAASGS
ncbi:laccase-1 [Aspergillus lentulus]|nr:laccase-1 [Aspergillus lentulus]